MAQEKNVEIERKFELAGLEGISGMGPGVLIEQGFLSTDPKRVTRVRVTSQGEAFLTVKGKASGARRKEVETPIDPEAAREMLTLCEGHLIQKIRRKAVFGGKVWEIDEFLGENKGLFVAEVELESESEPVEIPAWAGRELTEDHAYANSSLAMRPFSSWGKAASPAGGVSPSEAPKPPKP